MIGMYFRVCELGKRLIRGQTMTEYVLIVAAVAVVVLITYQLLGQNVVRLTNRVNSSLTTTWYRELPWSRARPIRILSP